MSGLMRRFIGGFLIAVILVGAMAGFIVVDLSTDRYMPGKMGPMMAVTSIGNDGVNLSFMGKYYYIDATPAASALEIAGEYQGLIPTQVNTAAAAAGLLAGIVSERINND